MNIRFHNFNDKMIRAREHPQRRNKRKAVMHRNSLPNRLFQPMQDIISILQTIWCTERVRSFYGAYMLIELVTELHNTSAFFFFNCICMYAERRFARSGNKNQLARHLMLPLMLTLLLPNTTSHRNKKKHMKRKEKKARKRPFASNDNSCSLYISLTQRAVYMQTVIAHNFKFVAV